MGWFEDSDDEDGNGDGDGLKSQQRQGLLTFDKTDHVEPDHIDKDEPKKSHSNDGHGEGDEDVDPLDAYMKALDHSAASKHAPIQTTVESGSSALSENESTNPHHQKRASDHRYHGGRLDVDNEDEATSHWVEASKATSEGNQAEPPRAGDFFVNPNQHANTNTNTNTNVDVALESVDHDRIAYAPVRKCLLLSGEKGQTPNNSTSEGHEWRRRHKVSFHPPSLSVDPIYDLQELREVLPRGVLEWSAKTRHDRLTPVQSQTLGVALSGFDAVVTAPTGSGKTLAFLYPVVAHLLANNNNDNDNDNDNNAESRALVLVPTRELAVQVKRVARSLLAGLPWKVCAVTGGHGPGRYQLSQTLEATRPHCWVATPGRLLDVIRCKHSRKQPHWLLTSVTMLVLDEADKLLGCAGFAPQVARILQSLRPDRQSLWVSATFRETLKRKLLQSRCSESPVVRISVGRTGASSENVDQHVVCLPDDRAKLEFLKGLWRDHQRGATAYTGQHTHQPTPTLTPTPTPLRTLVFVATRVSAETLAAQLRMVLPETAIETIHGDKHQADRTASLRAFARTGSDNDSDSGNDRFPRVLVATDVAGRGLDIPNVERVVQFDPAKNWDTHVHRIGRAGRLSSATESRGTAYTLLLPSDAGFARVLMRAYEREGRPFPAGLRSLGETTTGTANTGHRGQHRKRGASGDLSRENGSRQRNERWGPPV